MIYGIADAITGVVKDYKPLIDALCEKALMILQTDETTGIQSVELTSGEDAENIDIVVEAILCPGCDKPHVTVVLPERRFKWGEHHTEGEEST